MTTLWVSMAFTSGRFTLWLIITLLIMIDDGYPRMTAAGKQSWRHYYNSTNIDTMEVSPRCLDRRACQQVTISRCLGAENSQACITTTPWPWGRGVIN